MPGEGGTMGCGLLWPGGWHTTTVVWSMCVVECYLIGPISVSMFSRPATHHRRVAAPQHGSLEAPGSGNQNNTNRQARFKGLKGRGSKPEVRSLQVGLVGF